MREELAQLLRLAGVDVQLMQQCLDMVNGGEFSQVKEHTSLPNISTNPAIVDLVNSPSVSFNYKQAKENLARFPAALNYFTQLEQRGELQQQQQQLRLSQAQLRLLGRSLFSQFAFGLFNGGSSSSYFDRTRNQKYSPTLFELFSSQFDQWRQRYAHLPKGLTPAFVSTGGNSSPNFLELKLRSLLYLSAKAQDESVVQQLNRPIGFFQMTGVQTNSAIQQAMAELSQNKSLAPLLNRWSLDPCNYPYAIQPLIAAITHSKLGLPRNIFLDRQGLPLALPGGHGQCFVTLKGLFQDLQSQGYRYISLGNIDNLGYNPDAAILALLALSGQNAVFCGSYKTPVDSKGGVILSTDAGNFTCRDLGVGFEPELVRQAEQRGQAVLFNCAIGYFDLDYLLDKIDSIIQTLPLRVSDQEKDRGAYAQMEQVTWEVIGLLEKVLIVGVEKKRRFLAAKLLLENFINSGHQLDDYPDNCQELKELALELSDGMHTILAEDMGLNHDLAMMVF